MKETTETWQHVIRVNFWIRTLLLDSCTMIIEKNVPALQTKIFRGRRVWRLLSNRKRYTENGERERREIIEENDE